MQYIFLGLALLVIILLIGRAFITADPRVMAQKSTRTMGVLLLVLAAVLAVRGGMALAVPIAFFAFTLLSGGFPWSGSPGGRSRKSGGQRSTVRTALLDMALDHDTGAMEGRVNRGKYSGRMLSSMSPDELDELLQEARLNDPQAQQLLEAYIDRVGGGARQGNRSSARQGASTMTLEEAYAYLGLKAGAKRDEIQSAHRNLMKKFHPDQGGTDYMAAKLNEAKDVLLEHVRE
jgi:hypothetical protein